MADDRLGARSRSRVWTIIILESKKSSFWEHPSCMDFCDCHGDLPLRWSNGGGAPTARFILLRGGGFGRFFIRAIALTGASGSCGGGGLRDRGGVPPRDEAIWVLDSVAGRASDAGGAAPSSYTFWMWAFESTEASVRSVDGIVQNADPLRWLLRSSNTAVGTATTTSTSSRSAY